MIIEIYMLYTYIYTVGKLSAPDIVPLNHGSTQLTISWNSLNGSECGMVEYHLQLHLLFGEILREVSTTNLSYTFSGLSAGTYYNISVYGSNNAGNGGIRSVILATKSN